MLLRALRSGRRAGSLAATLRAPCVGSGFKTAGPPACGLSSSAPVCAEARRDAQLGNKGPEGSAFRPAPAGSAPAPAPQVAPAADSPSVPWSELEPEAFNTVCSMELGKLWGRLESALGNIEQEGSSLDFEVKPDKGALCVMLPYDGKVVIRKDCDSRLLVVESNLFEPWEDRDAIEFRPVGEGQWVAEDEQGLYDFLSAALSRYIKAPVTL